MKQRHGPAHAREANIQVVNDEFFHSLNIPVLQGRTFDARDHQGNRPVAIINRRVAKQTFPHSDALGRQIQLGGPFGKTWFTIIGVVPTVKTYSLSQTIKRGTLYFPLAQATRMRNMTDSIGLTIKTTVPPESKLDPAIAIMEQ
jgi:hypothetical protein